MTTGIDPTVDYVFKKLFGSEANVNVLADILNAVLNPPAERRLVSLEIRNPFNEKETFDDKLSVVDVKARDQRGENYNLEMQMCATPTYPERVLYYWAKIYAEQLKEGDDYDKLKPTVSISFMNDILFPEVVDHHLTFQLCSTVHTGLVFSRVAAIHVIELPKFCNGANELASPLDAWCYFLKHAAGLDVEQLPPVMKMPAILQAMEVLNVISKTDLERERYEARLRLERDQRSLAKWANEAHEIGIEEGVEKGVVVGRIQLVQRLLKMPMTPKAELLALSLEDLESKAKTLEDQLPAND